MSNEFMLYANLFDLMLWSIGAVSLGGSVILCLAFTVCDIYEHVRVAFVTWRDKRLTKCDGPAA